MAFYWRIWGAVVIVNLAVLTAFVGLATLQFANIGSDLAGERLLVLAGRTAAPFASAAQLGLPLSTVRNADALLEQARQTDEAISAIHVYDADGRIVHSTASPAPNEIQPEALEARNAAGGVSWFLESDQELMSSVDIVSAAGDSAGGILVVYSSANIATRVWAMVAQLAMSALAVLLIAVVLSGLALRLGMARQIGFFEAIERTILTFERHSWRGTAGRQRKDTETRDADELLKHCTPLFSGHIERPLRLKSDFRTVDCAFMEAFLG